MADEIGREILAESEIISKYNVVKVSLTLLSLIIIGFHSSPRIIRKKCLEEKKFKEVL